MTIAALAPALFLALFALIPQPPYGAEPFHDAWRRHAIVAVALLIWICSLAARRRLASPSGLLLPLLVLLAMFVAANFIHSDWRLGVEPLLDLLAGILVLEALAGTPGLSSTSLTLSLMLSASALAVVALHEVWDRWQDWLALVRAVPGTGSNWLPPTVPRVLDVGTNPNILAPLLTLSVPLVIYSLLRTRGPLRWLAALSLCIVQVAIFFTLSRSAWIGEGFGLAVAGAGLLAARRSSRLPLRRVSIQNPPSRQRLKALPPADGAPGIIAAGVAIAIVAIAVLAVTLLRGERPLWLFRPSLAARSDFRAGALLMIARSPLLGTGPGRFVLIYPLISNGDPAGAVHSHNVPIQIAVDAGLLGLAAAALVAGIAAFLLCRLWRHGNLAERWRVAAVAGGFAAFAAAGMGDALHLFPEILFALGALLAIVLRTPALAAGASRLPASARSHAPLADFGARCSSALMPALAIFLIAAWIRIDLASWHYGHALRLAADQQWRASAAEAARASAIDPELAVYHAQSGVALEVEAESTGSAAIREQAVAEFRRALEIEPRSASIRMELAVTLANGDRMSDAESLLPQIVRDAPRDPLTLLGAGVLEERIRPEDSLPVYAAALAQSPRIVDSPFWQQSEFRRQHYQEIVARALAIAAQEDSSAGPEATREIIADGAGVRISGQGFVARVDLARWYITQGDDLAASQILNAALRERPDDPSVRLALGELDAARGDLVGARRQWLAGAYLGDTASIMDLGNTFDPDTVPRAAQSLASSSLQDLWVRQFSITQQQYRFAFRRQEPLPVVLRGEWLNALPLVYSQMSRALSSWQAGTTQSGG